MTQRIRYGVLCSLLLAGVGGGCGLFEPRDPEAPNTGGSNFEAPTTPSIVLRNLESAIAYANPNDYRKCFSDTSKGLPRFIFYPSVQGMAVAPTDFSGWSIEQEETYIRNIFAELQKDAVAGVQFTPPEVNDVPIGDSVVFTANYVVNFPHTRIGAERQAEGLLQFTFRRSVQNEWYITSWKDFIVDDKTSWSVIKGRFIN